MTPGSRDIHDTDADAVLDGLYPQLVEHLSAQYAANYDTQAGLARFTSWLSEHTQTEEDDATQHKDRGSQGDTSTGKTRDEPDLVPLTVQHVFRAHQMDKIEMLARILQANGRGLSMVFCRTKRSADQVAEALTTRGFAAAAVHDDLGQGQRERAMRAFRNGKIDVLVATDVAARGLDVDDVTHVINYECPRHVEAYLHRTGRTGRDSIAVTFVDWRDMPRWKLINEALGMGIPEPPETYSTSEHLFEALDIPAGVTGSLPWDQRERPGLEAEELEDIGETGKARSPRRPGLEAEELEDGGMLTAYPRK